MSRLQKGPKNQTGFSSVYKPKDSKFLSISEKISQIALSMKSPLNSYSKSTTPDVSNKENLNRRTSFINTSCSPLEKIFTAHNLEAYLMIFKENDLTFDDLPSLTKEDLIDMKIPLGPRKRLMKIIESTKDPSEIFQVSPKRIDVQEEKYKLQSNVFSKRSQNTTCSRRLSVENSFDAEMDSQKVLGNLSEMIRDVNKQQNFMIKAIQENQREIAILRQEIRNPKKCICFDHRN